MQNDCVGFIDGNEFGSAAQAKFQEHLAAYNNHQWMQELKFQTIPTPDGLIVHNGGLMSECRRDMAIYVEIEMNWQLSIIRDLHKGRYCLEEDSEYNRRANFSIRSVVIIWAQSSSNNPINQLSSGYCGMVVKRYWNTLDDDWLWEWVEN